MPLDAATYAALEAKLGLAVFIIHLYENTNQQCPPERRMPLQCDHQSVSRFPSLKIMEQDASPWMPLDQMSSSSTLFTSNLSNNGKNIKIVHNKINPVIKSSITEIVPTFKASDFTLDILMNPFHNKAIKFQNFKI